MAKHNETVVREDGRISTKFTVYLTVCVLVASFFLPMTVSAAQLTSRKLTLGSSAGNTATTWTFEFSAPGTTALNGISFQVCTTASGACSTPGSWSNSGATFSTLTYNGSGQAGWTLDNTGAGGAQFLGIKNNSSATSTANPIIATFNTVTNPSTTNATFYVRVASFTGDDFSGALDSGVVAASTAQQISFTGTIDESLTFCTGTSGITNSSCAGATGSSVDFTTFSPSSTNSATSQIGVGTNALSGYAVTVAGSTLTCSACSGSPTISALASQATSSIGVEQFGFNLRDNATPNVGTDPDGAGDAAPTANYNTVDQYRFVSGDSIASDAEPDSFRRFHAAYIVNIDTASEAGVYTSTFTFVATAIF